MFTKTVKLILLSLHPSFNILIRLKSTKILMYPENLSELKVGHGYQVLWLVTQNAKLLPRNSSVVTNCFCRRSRKISGYKNHLLDFFCQSQKFGQS